MKFSSIRTHLQPYVIMARRRTTINHAFAAAVAPSDGYDEERVRAAIIVLGQDPDQDLRCAYCGSPAETWDHVFATVRSSAFSGYGHRLGNLLPCCKPCNSSKGNKDWWRHLQLIEPDPLKIQERVQVIENYLTTYTVADRLPDQSPEYLELQSIRKEVLALFQRADELAAKIRMRARP